MRGWLVVVMLLLDKGSSLCPQYCQCLWRSSKITVDCGGARLTHLPHNVEPVTQVLNMTGASLPLLHSDVFTRAGLPNLQRLYLRQCNITSLHSRTFAGLINLVELDLTGNRLVAVPSQAFYSLPTLSSLTLSGNKLISSITERAFEALPNLVKLDLSDCGISVLASGAFLGLPHLGRLLLSGNSLETLQDPYVFPLSLNQLSLSGNPWQCDCHLAALREWLVLQVLITTAPSPLCLGPPSLASLAIQEVPQSSLACAPTISPTSLHVTAEQGRDVTLHCLVQSQPPASVSWSFNHSLITAGNIEERKVGEGGLQSSLTVERVGPRWAGYFTCRAVNTAGAAEGSYRLSVLLLEGEEQPPQLLQLQLHYFVLVAAGSLVFFVLTSISLSLGCILLCRRRIKGLQEKEQKLGPEDTYPPLHHPDILSDLAKSRPPASRCRLPSSSSFSLDTATTPASVTSSTLAVLQPTRGQCQASREGGGKYWTSREEGGQYWTRSHQLGEEGVVSQSPSYPQDFGLPRVGSSISSSLQPLVTRLAYSQGALDSPRKLSLPMRADEQYPGQVFLHPALHPAVLAPALPTKEAREPSFHPMGLAPSLGQGPETVHTQEQIYEQIHSLTISGYEHHEYESLPGPRDTVWWQAWRREQGHLSRIQSVETFRELSQEEAAVLHTARYRKSSSMPVLDMDLCGETEI